MNTPNVDLKNTSTNISIFVTQNKWPILITLLWVLTYLTWTGKIMTNNMITVSGTSINTTRNQVATFSVNVAARNIDKSKAVAEVNKKADAVVAAVKQFGILDEDVKTNNMNIYQREEPVYKDGRQTYEKTDWNANVGVEIQLKDVDKSNDLSVLLSGLEIDSMYGPNFTLDAKKMDEASLLDLAIKDAEKKAGVMARGMGKQLGEAVSIVEGYSSYSSGPIYYAMDKGGVGAGGSGMQPGSTDVSKTVTVTFRLK